MVAGSFLLFWTVCLMQAAWHILICGKKPKKEKPEAICAKPTNSKVAVPNVTPVASAQKVVSPRAPKKSTKLSADDPVSAHTESKKLLFPEKNAKDKVENEQKRPPVPKPKQSKGEKVPEPSKPKPAIPEEVKVVKTVRDEEKPADGKDSNALAPVVDNPYVTEVTDEFPTVEETKEASLKDSKKGSKKDKKPPKTDRTQE